MAAVTVISLCVSTSDGGMIQTCWAPIDADVAARIRGLLGEPLCEALLDGDAAAAVGEAGDAHGAVVVFADDS